MSEAKTIAPDMQEVVAHLEKAGFPEICLTSRAHRLSESMAETNGIDFFEWPVIHLLAWRCPGQSLEEMRQRAAQCLLDAGYRNFHSGVNTSVDHHQARPAEHTPEHYNGCVVIEFMNGIEKFTAEQIEQAIAYAEKAQAKRKQYQETAKRKRELVSLDKGLRKAGLID
jgi:hypothetical protein